MDKAIWRSRNISYLAKKKKLATPSWCKFLLNAAPGGQSLSLQTLMLLLVLLPKEKHACNSHRYSQKKA